MIGVETKSTGGTKPPTTDTYHEIEIQVEGDGTINPGGGIDNIERVREGSSETFTMHAASGWYLDDVLVDGVSVGKITSYEFTNVQKDHLIKAIFKQEEVPPIGPVDPTDPTEPTKPQTTLPQTGDNSCTTLWLLIAVLSALAILFLWKKKEKHD